MLAASSDPPTQLGIANEVAYDQQDGKPGSAQKDQLPQGMRMPSLPRTRRGRRMAKGMSRKGGLGLTSASASSHAASNAVASAGAGAGTQGRGTTGRRVEALAMKRAMLTSAKESGDQLEGAYVDDEDSEGGGPAAPSHSPQGRRARGRRSRKGGARAASAYASSSSFASNAVVLAGAGDGTQGRGFDGHISAGG